VLEVLVKTLLEAKKSRQFIFVSHNANVAVLGDAERAFELAARDRKGWIAAFGNVDEMRERLESCLEGGREAFLRRSERYGHTPKRLDADGNGNVNGNANGNGNANANGNGNGNAIENSESQP
jgi:hypothetical protein